MRDPATPDSGSPGPLPGASTALAAEPSAYLRTRIQPRALAAVR